MLTTFSYVFIVRGDDRFWRTYGSLFDPDRRKTDFLFRVSYKPSGELFLKPLQWRGIGVPATVAPE